MSINPEYLERYKSVIIEFESLCVLLKQLSSCDYNDFSIYVNNLTHLRDRQQAITKNCSEHDFWEWLKSRDTDLSCNIIATGLAYRMVDNLLVNLLTNIQALKRSNIAQDLF